ncbi:Right handed beta helix region [Bradyrhizobium lablabi]|uniref:Right handed beta helix region n=1 Tax=Bradyrhizobium lablabi TaxID=722472 RepID=A0A1M6JC85_9BRAD|nr:Right handed beta helix region [Bradyrhizobium lablabi]
MLLCLLAATSVQSGVLDEPCPAATIAIEPGASIQAAVDRSGDGAAFCLKNGIHRIQAVRPRPNQRFYGEGRTILNGSRLLMQFGRENNYWVARGQRQNGQRRGECAKEAPACNLPEGLFIDDIPLVQVLAKDEVGPGRFYFDHAAGDIYFADDPAGHKVEATVAAFAFESSAPGILVKNMTIEKYASVAQKGAIQAQQAAGWVVENCELRLNSAAGIAAGSGTRVRDCNIHHNGQIGITGVGRDVLIERNRIWENNTREFLSSWEAGGVKLAVSEGVVLRGNYVHDNRGAGLWCDIECRDVLYEDNIAEHNHGAGIFHEISFSAVIHNNIVRHNGSAEKIWFWGNNILVAASQDVEIYDNTLTADAGKCGIVLVDQGRRMKSGGTYKTRNNKVYDNDTIFEGAACAGAASDVRPGDENASVIEDGNNLFDRNIYRVPRGNTPLRFAWGHAVFGWEELHRAGIEQNGSLIIY